MPDTQRATPLSQNDSAVARVLIVEDDDATRVGLTELVRAWGYCAEDASDGQEALSKVTMFEPAVILADLVMPRVGGLELLRAFSDQLSDITFIIVTAQGSVDSAVAAIKEGAYDYLTKPVDPQRLKILLDQAVERQETLRKSRSSGGSSGSRATLAVRSAAAPVCGECIEWSNRPHPPMRQFSSPVSREPARNS